MTKREFNEVSTAATKAGQNASASVWEAVHDAFRKWLEDAIEDADVLTDEELDSFEHAFVGGLSLA